MSNKETVVRASFRWKRLPKSAREEVITALALLSAESGEGPVREAANEAVAVLEAATRVKPYLKKKTDPKVKPKPKDSLSNWLR